MRLHVPLYSLQAVMRIPSSSLHCPDVSGPTGKGQHAPPISQQEGLPICRHNQLEIRTGIHLEASGIPAAIQPGRQAAMHTHSIVTQVRRDDRFLR
jgi:hypothetical protein